MDSILLWLQIWHAPDYEGHYFVDVAIRCMFTPSPIHVTVNIHLSLVCSAPEYKVEKRWSIHCWCQHRRDSARSTTVVKCIGYWIRAFTSNQDATFRYSLLSFEFTVNDKPFLSAKIFVYIDLFISIGSMNRQCDRKVAYLVQCIGENRDRRIQRTMTPR